MDELAVTVQTGALCNPAVPWLNLDRLVEPTYREREGVEESVIGLRHPLPDRVRGEMTVVAHRGTCMARVLPRV